MRVSKQHSKGSACAPKTKHAQRVHHVRTASKPGARCKTAPGNPRAATLAASETRGAAAGDLGTMVKDDTGPAVSTRKRKAEEEHVQPLGASRSVS